MHFLVLIALAWFAVAGCSPPREAGTGHHVAGAGKTDAGGDHGFTYGHILARIVGPHEPTADSAISVSTNAMPLFWVTLDVVDAIDGFGAELRGRTIRLRTSPFDPSLIGATVPLRLSFNSGASEDSRYRLTCTSVEISRISARPSPKL